MKRTYRHHISTLALAISLGTSAFAADLRQDIMVKDTAISFGDIFTDAGDATGVTFMASPAPGGYTQISAYELEKLALKHGIDWERPAFLKKVRISRKGYAVSQEHLTTMVEDAARSHGIYDDIQVRLYGTRSNVFLASAAQVQALSFHSFTLNQRQDRFTATITSPGSATDGNIRLTGTLERVRAVPVLAGSLTPGEIITEADITWQTIAVRRINASTIQTLDALVGKTLRRPVSAGGILRTSDVMRPQMVKKGAAVHVTLAQGGMFLSSTGKALENGGDGDMIRVMNLRSKKTIEARITGPNSVEIVSASPLRLASR